MSTPVTPAHDAIATATTNLQPDLVAVAGTGLGIGAVVFAIRKGWRLVKGFVS